MDPERLARVREQFCPKPGEQAPAITEEQLAALPPEMLERLKGPDGKVDPERLEQLRARFCSGDQPEEAGRQAQGAAQQGGGPVVIAGGPGGGGGQRGPGGGGGGGLRGGGGGGGGGFGGGQSADGRGRWFFNLNYQLQIENEVRIAPGGPVLDLLDGGALSGTQPRHTVQLNAGLFYGGFGANLNARYIGSSRIDGSGLPGSTDLFFGDLATFNLRVFADLNQRTGLIEKVPLLKNTRISFAMNNVFDARQRITDDSGEVPLRYQPYLVDPTGRFFEIELRKLF